MPSTPKTNRILFQPINNDPTILLGQFIIHVECESPGASNNSMAIYRVTINHFVTKKEWFVLQHYSGFERLLKFLKKNENYKNILKQYGIKSLPKKPSIINLFAALPDYVQGVSNFVTTLFSEKTFLQIEEVQIFFAIDKHKVHQFNNFNFFKMPPKIADQNNNALNSKLKEMRIASSSDQKNKGTNSPAAESGISSLHSQSVNTMNTMISTSSGTGSATSHSSQNNSKNGSIPNSPTNWNLAGTLNRQIKPADFEFLKVIGKGSFGKVLLAQDRLDGMFYAVKVLNKATIIKKNEQGHIMAERNVLSKNLSHPFLVSLHYSFQTPEKLYFVLDYWANL